MSSATVFLVLLAVFAFVDNSFGDKCTYENCHKFEKDMLNVHIVCHSHDDVGWLNTVDQYFWGNTGRDAVQYIIESVVSELQRNPDRLFSYAEAAFFYRWLLIQDDLTRHQVKDLISNGQLEIVGGGWSQNDEATPHYISTIGQMTLGHRFFNNSFGRCGVPKAAWQLDPFGHSQEMASLFAQMGLEGVFFARLHSADKTKRSQEKNLEFTWRGSQDLGAKSDIHGHVLYRHYSSPGGFCFDEYCNDKPIMDDERLDGFNVNERVDAFIKYSKEVGDHYKTNHVLITMGDDFQFRNAGKNFINLDRLIRHVNERQEKGSKVNVFYSTPGCYLNGVKGSGVKFETKTDDFFPYGSSKDSYWTGYFTSRPALKGAERYASSVLQAAQAIDTVGGLGVVDQGDLEVLRQAIGVLQHHDAITGTAKQHVTNDYHKMLHYGLVEAQLVFQDALNKLAPKDDKTPNPPFHTLCLALNASSCNVTQKNNQFLVTIYNGWSQELDTFLRIPVTGTVYTVEDPAGADVPHQISATFTTPQITEYQGPNDLTFPIKVPAIGYATYYVTPKAHLKQQIVARPRYSEANREAAAPLRLFNDFLEVKFDENNLLETITDKKSGQTVSVKQSFYWYEGRKGASGRGASGAYAFRPAGNEPNPVAKGVVSAQIITGVMFNEVRQTFSPWLTQTVRLYTTSPKPYLEFDWVVGAIPDGDHVTKEIITRFDTSINSKTVFYTDANGRQMLNRTRNFQPTYKYENTEPISGNYYPVNTRISIKDDKTQLTILNDRPQGGSSVKSGSVELMIHRRCFEDDGYGVGEALNEPGNDGKGLVVRGLHWLLLSTPAEAAKLHRQYGQELFYQPAPTFAPYEGSFDDYAKKYNTQVSGLKKPLPTNVKILTLTQWQGAEVVMLRLEHVFQKNENPELSKPVTIDINEYLAAFQITSMTERYLSGVALPSGGAVTGTKVTLEPQQIRTFRCEVKLGKK